MLCSELFTVIGVCDVLLCSSHGFVPQEQQGWCLCLTQLFSVPGNTFNFVILKKIWHLAGSELQCLAPTTGMLTISFSWGSGRMELTLHHHSWNSRRYQMLLPLCLFLSRNSPPRSVSVELWGELWPVLPSAFPCLYKAPSPCCRKLLALGLILWTQSVWQWVKFQCLSSTLKSIFPSACTWTDRHFRAVLRSINGICSSSAKGTPPNLPDEKKSAPAWNCWSWILRNMNSSWL